LEQYGDYFRLQFIPQTSSSPAQASPEIIPASSTSTSSSSQTIEARVLRCQPNPKGLQATVLTKPGRRYEVSVIDTHGKASQTRQFVAHSGTETVQFTTHGLPNPALIQAKLLK
jgi:hypothetical protein